MKPVSPAPSFALAIITAASHKATKSPHLAAFSTQPSYHQRRHEEESRAVRVSVWWDFENCHVPVNANAFRVAQCITNAIRANGIKGPIDITAFGDVMQVSRTNQEALSATGINLTHVPSGGKNSADRSLLVDLMYWVSKNPPPAHLFLISGDRDFAGILHRLRMSNYNILLASSDSAPNVLCSAATIMWQWSSLLKGENLTGKLYNQPPDGPYNSWYGHFKAPIEDPFAITENSSCPSADESSLLAAEPKLRSIPKNVLRHISQIVKSHPEGISIVQLRAEMKINLDKDLYGYKKFSRFLSAMPQILELHGDNGNLFVRSVNAKSRDELVSSANEETATNNGETEFASDTESLNTKSKSKDVIEKSTVGSVSDLKLKPQLMNFQEARKEEKERKPIPLMNMQNVKTEAHTANQKEENRMAALPKRKVQETQEEDWKVKSKNQPQKDEVATPIVESKGISAKNDKKTPVSDDNTSFSGIFQRIWMKLFGNGSSDAKKDKSLSEKDAGIEKSLTLSKSSEPIRPALFSPSSHEAVIDKRNSQSSSWFKFWRSPKSDDIVDKNGETAVNIKPVDENKVVKNRDADLVGVKSKQPEIFAKESFWKEIESFIHSSQGSALFSKARSREHLAQHLQKNGPPILRSLSENDLLQLVCLLISEKEWVEEHDFRRYPFRLTHPSPKYPENNRPSNSNGLSHFFSERQANPHESKESKNQNHPHSGVPQPIVHTPSSSKSRSEILADCQKLIDYIVKEYPEGFNIGGFRKLFLEKYGYPVDPQKLGHEKLVNFLKVLPGVLVESNLILPATALKNLTSLYNQESNNSSIMSKKNDESDSWDELGPVDNSGSEKDEMDVKVSNSRKGIDQRLPSYEPLREDDFSDSEEECLENEGKPKLSEESALLDILDSWHGQKEGDSKSGLNISSTPKIVSETVKTARKQKPQMSYTFVKDQPADGKDKLIDGILGSLKKSSDNSADSQVLS